MKELSFNKNKLLEKYNPIFAMAYGSGIFKQKGYSTNAKPMLDFVFGVDNTNWHVNNYVQNKEDYSLIMGYIIKSLNQNLLEKIQQAGAGVFYNPLIPFEDQKIKYGVIMNSTLIDDLIRWDSLYIAGRLHKPTFIFKSTPKIDEAIKINLESVVNVSLLMLPEKFTKDELGIMITKISYLGDTRGLFENPQKIKNIYEPNKEEFDKIYHDTLQNKCFKNAIAFLNDDCIQQNMDLEIRDNLHKSLPSNLFNVNPDFRFNFPSKTKEDYSLHLRNSISAIVKASSGAQTMKGILTAGPIKSVKYAFPKVYKGIAPRIKSFFKFNQ